MTTATTTNTGETTVTVMANTPEAEKYLKHHSARVRKLPASSRQRFNDVYIFQGYIAFRVEGCWGEDMPTGRLCATREEAMTQALEVLKRNVDRHNAKTGN